MALYLSYGLTIYYVWHLFYGLTIYFSCYHSFKGKSFTVLTLFIINYQTSRIRYYIYHLSILTLSIYFSTVTLPQCKQSLRLKRTFTMECHSYIKSNTTMSFHFSNASFTIAKAIICNVFVTL